MIMLARYVRTAAGQAEIQSRALHLGRPVRNLLLVINASRTMGDWLSQLHGVTADDVRQLLAAGLIVEATATASTPGLAGQPGRPTDLRELGAKPAPAAPAAVAARPVSDADWARAQQIIGEAGYTALYDALNSVGKAKLGLVRGYRFVLEVERCSGAAEMRALALKFAHQLRAEHGMAAVGELAHAIGAITA
jgi:hypothetical protein